MLVAAINCLENAVIRAESSLGRDVAHAQKHLKNIGKAVRLVEVVGRTLVKRPLEGMVVSKICSMADRSTSTYSLGEVLVVP